MARIFMTLAMIAAIVSSASAQVSNFYNPADHYWIVAGDTSQLYSSARKTYVPSNDAAYMKWQDGKHFPTRIDTETSLWDVLAFQAPQSLPGSTAAAQAAMQDREINQLPDRWQRYLFALENRVRALEGKAALTSAQFRTLLKAQ